MLISLKAIPRIESAGVSTGSGPDTMPFNSPRRNHVQEAANTTLGELDLKTPRSWQNFAQPLPLILQTFKDLSNQDYEFWHKAVKYFKAMEYRAGEVLYHRGDEPNGFYLLEEGILTAEYELEQGGFSESIVAGTTCGELPFFSNSERTGTVRAEKDCKAWLLTKAEWEKMKKDLPEVSNELMEVGFKLTKERMDAITS